MADQEIFLSWSKPASKAAAEAFKEFLPQLLHGVKPWMSSQDIAKGTAWFAAISDQLARSRSCLIFITPENLGSSWLYYEAGAVAHAMKGTRVFTYLIGVKPGDLSGTPLGQYQVTTFDRDDTRKLILDLNQTLEAPLPEMVLNSAFDGVWPKLQRRLTKISPKSNGPPPPAPASTPSMPPPLSDEAQRILIQAAEGDRKTVTMSETGHGFNLGAGGKDVVSDSKDERQEIILRAAVEQLLERGFIDNRFSSGNVFPVTKAGLDAAGDLKKAANPAKQRAPITDEADILVLLQGWVSKQRWGTHSPSISFADVDRELNLAPGSAAKLLEPAAAKASWVVDSKGTTVICFRHKRVIIR